MRAGADPGTVPLHRRLQANPLQLAHAVRRQEHAGTDLAEGRGLLIHGNIEAMSDQRVRRKQAADTPADDDNR